MNKTDQRQFLNELKALSKHKNHDATFGRALKGAIKFEKLAKMVEDKRLAYDHAYTNLYRKYNVPHDDLFGILDKLLQSCLSDDSSAARKKLINRLAEDAAIRVKKQEEGVSGNAIAAGAAGVGAGGAFLAGGLLMTFFQSLAAGAGLVYMTIVQVKLRKLWNSYKSAAIEFAESYTKSLL